ncbi:hypothetical protein CRG98_003739 [Punica granatum]|uniref:G-patch domain-containing protein n=1 Tax=Punica granatum TaxID=22663 RepID=A0A2I0L564_PUNGR|nr:hypothetical protein CRG98_003739 [Punica granatum]
MAFVPTVHLVSDPLPPPPAPTAVPLPPAAFLSMESAMHTLPPLNIPTQPPFYTGRPPTLPPVTSASAPVSTINHFPFQTPQPPMNFPYPAPPPLNIPPSEPGTPTQAAPAAPLTNIPPEAEMEQERRMKKMEETIKALQAGTSRLDYGDFNWNLFPGMRLPSKIKIPSFERYDGTKDPPYASEWRGKAAKRIPPISEIQQVQLFHSTLKGVYNSHLLSHASSFFELIEAGKKLDMGIKLGRIKGPTKKKEKEALKKHTAALSVAADLSAPPTVIYPPYSQQYAPAQAQQNKAVGEEEETQESPTPFIIEYVSAEMAVASAPFIIEVPAKEPYQDSRVPWNYGGEVANVEQELSAMGITRSGRVYQGLELADKGKASAAALNDNLRATSTPTKKGQGHLRALHIVCKCNNHVVGRVMIDNSSALNLCPVSTLKQMNVDMSRIRASKTTVRAFDGSRRDVNGEIDLLIDVGLCSFSVTFQILEIPNAFSLLLGRPWIHAAGAVPSSPHQKLKFFVEGKLITVNGEEDYAIYKETAILYISIGEDQNLPFHSFDTISVIQDYGEVGPSRTDHMIGKVMLKNDYVPGTGLGARAQGILRPIEVEEYRNRRGLGFRPSCHKIVQAQHVKHLHQLVAHYGKLSKSVSVPPLSQFFPAPPQVMGGSSETPFTESDDFSSDAAEAFLALPAIYAVIEETSYGVHVHPAREDEELTNWISIPLYSATVANVEGLDEDGRVPEIEESLHRLENHQLTSIEPTEEINIGTTEEHRTLKIGTGLEPAQRARMIDFLTEYQEVFAWSYADMPGLDPSIIKHFLPLDTERFPPKCQHLRRQRAELLLRIKEEVVKQVDVGFLEIQMAEEDKIKTTFITMWGTFCYKVMPFSLKNAGATYQRAMVTLFHDMMHKEIEVYVDDMIAKSKEGEDHLVNLKRLFDRLRKYKLRLNPAKCTFGVKSGKLLGFVVIEKGIEVDPDKVKAIMELPPPSTVCEVRSFLGRLNYIARFIANLTDKCQPLFRLLRKNAAVEWDDECQKAFDTVKAYLVQPPVLVPPSPDRPLILYLTVRRQSIGCMLGQKDDSSHAERAIYYLSKKFTEGESNYPEIEKMCCVLVWVMQRLRQYTLYYTIRLLSKTDPLKYLLNSSSSMRNIAKWHCQLTEYDIEILQVSDEEETLGWKMYFDGAINSTGSGIGVVLISPEGCHFPVAAKIDFPCTNNIAEYEACILGLQAAIELKFKELKVFGDSMLTIFQTLKQWKTKDPKLVPYHKYLEELTENFEDISFTYTPRMKNQFADALATLASMVNITKENLIEPCPLRCQFPAFTDRHDRRTSRRIAAHFFLSGETLYRRSFDATLLRCVEWAHASKEWAHASKEAHVTRILLVYHAN